jgi:hypothetical protein
MPPRAFQSQVSNMLSMGQNMCAKYNEGLQWNTPLKCYQDENDAANSFCFLLFWNVYKFDASTVA